MSFSAYSTFEPCHREPNPFEPCHFEPGINWRPDNGSNPGEKSLKSGTAGAIVSFRFRRFLALVSSIRDCFNYTGLEMTRFKGE